MYYIPLSVEAELIKSPITRDYIELFDRKGLERAFREAIKVMATRFEVSRRLTKNSEGRYLEVVESEDRSSYSATSENGLEKGSDIPAGQLGSSIDNKLVYQVADKSQTNIFHYTPSTRFFSHNTPVGERKFLLLGRMLGTFLAQPVQGKRVLDFMRDLVESDLDKNSFSFVKKNEIVKRHTVNISRGLKEKDERGRSYEVDVDERDVYASLTEDWISKDDYYVEPARINLMSKWEIESRNTSSWTFELWLDAFIKTVESLYALSVIGAATEEIYWARWHFNVRPLVEDLLSLLNSISVNSKIASFGLYILLTLKHFMRMMDRLLNLSEGALYEELPVERINLFDAVLNRNIALDLFDAFIEQERAIQLRQAENEVYNFAFDEIIIENGIANFQPKFYEQIINYSVSLALNASFDDAWFDLRMPEFKEKLPEFLENWLFLIGKNQAVKVPEEFELLINPLQMVGQRKVYTKRAIEVVRYECLHFLEFYKVVVEKFVQFVNTFFKRSTTAPQFSSTIRTIKTDGLNVAYYFEFFNNLDIVRIPLVGETLYDDVYTNSKKDGNKQPSLVGTRIRDFKVAHNAMIRIPSFNAYVYEDDYVQDLYKYSANGVDYYGVDLTIEGFKELFLEYFITMRWEDFAPDSVACRFESNLFSILPAEDWIGPLHLSIKGKLRRGSEKYFTIKSLPLEDRAARLDYSWVDLVFGFKDYEISDANQLQTLYEARLKWLGTEGMSFQPVRFPNVSRWVMKMRGREQLLNLVNAGDLYNTRDSVTRVQLSGVSSNTLYTNRKYLKKRFPRYFDVKFPVPIDLIVPEVLQNIRSGDVVFETTNITRGDKSVLVVKNTPFPVGDGEFFKQALTAELRIDLLRDNGLSYYKLREEAGDEVIFHVESALSFFKDVSTVLGQYVTLIGSDFGSVYQDWNDLFDHPCSRCTSIKEALHILIRNLCFAVPYGLRDLSEVQDQLKKTHEWMERTFPESYLRMKVNDIFPVLLNKNLNELLTELCTTEDVVSFNSLLEDVFGGETYYKQTMPVLIHVDADVCLDDVRFGRRKILGKRPALNPLDFSLPSSIFFDDTSVLTTIAKLFANVQFEKMYGGVV